jgi:hypothetical protein
MVGVPGGDPARAECDFPKSSGGKWDDTVDAARKDWDPNNQSEDAVFVVRGDWVHSTEYDRQRRRVTIRIFAKDFQFNASACGTAKAKTVCENSPSKGAKAFNTLRYRLDEAKKLKDENKLGDCRAATYEAVALSRGLPWFRETRKKYDYWTEGNTYLTRYDGELSEDAVFSKAKTYGEEAEKLHAECGGSASLDTREEDERAVFPTEDETKKAAAEYAEEQKQDKALNASSGGMGFFGWVMMLLLAGGVAAAVRYRQQLPGLIEQVKSRLNRKP